LEDKIRVEEVWRVLKCLDVRTVATAVGVLATIVTFAFTLGYHTYPWWNEDTIAPVRRFMPRHMNIAEVLLADRAQRRFPWLVPTIAFLEGEAKSEVSAGRWKDSFPVVLVCEPFEAPTSEFAVEVRATQGHDLTGYAYRVFGEQYRIQYQPLGVTVRGVGSVHTLRVSFPESNQDDRLMLVLRLSGSDSMATSDSDIRDLMHLHVQGR
jgi:hypothetical protein